MSNRDLDFDPTIQLQPVNTRFAPAKSGNKAVLYTAVAGGVLLSAATLFAIVWKVAALGSSQGLLASVTAHRSPDELRAESVAAFTDFDAAAERLKQRSAAEAQERDAIIQLFRDLESVASAEDSDRFRSLVDFERQLSRVERTGNMRGWSNFRKRAVKNEMRAAAEADSYWKKITIVSILPAADDPDTRVVYAFGWESPYDEQTEHRFWIARFGGTWKLYDWARLDLGLSQSEEWGVFVRHENALQMAGYRRWISLINEADTLMGAGNRQAAMEKLRMAESQLVPEELQNLRWIHTGHRWVALNENAEAERCYRTAPQPDNAPGAYYGIMESIRERQPAEALKYADLYETTVGPNPDLSKIRAALLKQLGRNDEALEEWKKVLRADPANVEALTAILNSLSNDDRAGLTPYLERIEDPVKAVVDLAPSFAYRDSKKVAYFAHYLEQKAPAAAGSYYVAGLMKSLDGQHRDAAALYRQAIDAEPDEAERTRYVTSYMEAMIADGRVLEIGQSLPDPKKAFENLVASYDEGDLTLTDIEYRQLVDQYRKQLPSELDPLERKANFELSRNNYAEAEGLLRRCLRLSASDNETGPPESQPESLSSSLALALFKQGKVQEAYDSVSDQQEGFSTLADVAVSDGRWDDLRTLVELERAKDASSGKLHLAEAELAAHEKRWDDAFRHFDEHLSLPGQDTNKYGHNHRKQELYIEAGRWLDFYTMASDHSEAFDGLAARLIMNSKWDELEALVATHKNESPDDVHIARHLADAAWAKDDYPTYIERAQEVLARNDVNTFSPYVRDRLEEQLLSAFIRTNQFDRAMQLAESNHKERNGTTYLAIVTAALGDWPASNRWARDVANSFENAAVLYSNDDVGHLFASQHFGDLQREFPVETQYDNAPTLAVFFLNQPFKLEANDITAAATKAGTEQPVTVELVRSIRKDVKNVFAIRAGEAVAWIAVGDGKYFERPQPRGNNSTTLQAFNNSQGWLAVGVASWREVDRKRADKIAREIAAQLTDGQSDAFLARGKEFWQDFYLYPATAELIAAWRSANDLAPYKDQAITLAESSYDSGVNREFDRQLYEAVRALEATPGTRLEVVECVPGALLFDPLRLRVTSVRRSLGSMEFDGVLVNTARLIPQLREGLSMRFSSGTIEAWRLNDEQPVYRRGDRKGESASQ